MHFRMIATMYIARNNNRGLCGTCDPISRGKNRFAFESCPPRNNQLLFISATVSIFSRENPRSTNRVYSFRLSRDDETPGIAAITRSPSLPPYISPGEEILPVCIVGSNVSRARIRTYGEDAIARRRRIGLCKDFQGRVTMGSSSWMFH